MLYAIYTLYSITHFSILNNIFKALWGKRFLSYTINAIKLFKVINDGMFVMRKQSSTWKLAWKWLQTIPKKKIISKCRLLKSQSLNSLLMITFNNSCNISQKQKKKEGRSKHKIESPKILTKFYKKWWKNVLATWHIMTLPFLLVGNDAMMFETRQKKTEVSWSSFFVSL